MERIEIVVRLTEAMLRANTYRPSECKEVAISLADYLIAEDKQHFKPQPQEMMGG